MFIVPFGGRAEKARQSLMSIGYTDVVNLGGIEDVKASVEHAIGIELFWFLKKLY